MSLIDNLTWRYATKRMNGELVSQDKVEKILESIRLTPTSMGMQAFKVFVIKNQELKDKIYREACPQTQIKTCSHLLVFTAFKEITDEIVDKQIRLIANVRSVPEATLNPFKEKLSAITEKSPEMHQAWTARQTYIALGLAMVAAAEEKVDSTPIEGFNSTVLDGILDLNKQNLASVTMLTLGYRSEDDSFASLKKVRKDYNDIFVKL